MSDLDLSMARPALDFPTVADLGADVVPVEGRGMVTLRGDFADAGFAAALNAATGCAVPETRRSTEANGNRALWMSPDELMLFCDWAAAPGIAEAFQREMGEAHALALNVSDARAVFRVSGAKASRVLSKGAPVDLAPDRFAVGEVRRTRIATVAAGIVRTDEDAFEVFCFRSYAAYLWDWLTVAAKQDGLSDL